jgi:uncharacterized protein YndB with AHSA1/START domain
MEVTREIVLPAGPQEVWEAVTDPARLEAWFANDVDLELRPGGAGRFRWDDGDTRIAVVEEVEERRRFAFRWEEEDGAAPARVELELQEDEDGTRVVVTETPLAPQASAGWATALELRALAGTPALARR